MCLKALLYDLAERVIKFDNYEQLHESGERLVSDRPRNDKQLHRWRQEKSSLRQN